jgi:hypothetical protein
MSRSHPSGLSAAEMRWAASIADAAAATADASSAASHSTDQSDALPGAVRKKLQALDDADARLFVSCHTSHVTHHTSNVTHHTSHVTRHTSHITCHTSHVTRSFSSKFPDLEKRVSSSVCGLQFAMVDALFTMATKVQFHIPLLQALNDSRLELGRDASKSFRCSPSASNH